MVQHGEMEYGEWTAELHCHSYLHSTSFISGSSYTIHYFLNKSLLGICLAGFLLLLKLLFCTLLPSLLWWLLMLLLLLDHLLLDHLLLDHLLMDHLLLLCSKKALNNLCREWRRYRQCMMLAPCQSLSKHVCRQPMLLHTLVVECNLLRTLPLIVVVKGWPHM